MKEILEQLNKLVDNYIEVKKLYDRMCMFANIEESAIENLKEILLNIRSAINITTNKLVNINV